MADIQIEKKKTIWPWVLLGLLLLAGIIYFVWCNNNQEVGHEAQTIQQVEETTTLTALEKYTTHIGDEGKMGLDHEYSNGALIYLIEAVQEIADEKQVNLWADLSEARRLADEITEDPSSLKHADKIKNAGNIISKALATLQTQSYPDLANEATAVQNAVSEIKVATPTLDQKDAVNALFTTAEDLLIKMK